VISSSFPPAALIGYALGVKESVGVAAPEAQDLAARLAAGDPAAVAWLYDHAAPDLYQRLRRRYGFAGGPDAADLLQETFLLCLRDGCHLLRGCLAGQAPEAPALPLLQRYLWDLACGLAANARRSVWSRRVVAMPAAPLAAPEPPAERSAVSRDALARLGGCLEGSGERLYLYFKLRYVDGLTPDEIAAGTGWSKKATYKLKQALNEAVERCVGKLGLALGSWLPALAALTLLLAASACRREAPRLPVAVVVRGNQDVLLASDGRPRPLLVGRSHRAALCFAAPAREDTSRWEAVLTFAGEASPTGFAAAAARAGSTLCFEGEIPPGLCCSSRLALCGTLVDRFDGRRWRLPCREVALQPDSARIDGLENRFAALMKARASLPLDELLRRLDALGAAALPALPLTAARFQMVAAQFLTAEGTPAALDAAAGRLSRLPAWLDAGDAAVARSLQADFQRGRLALARGEREAAWLAFQRAEAKAVGIADPTLLAVVLQQADLLSQAGAPDEALARVREVLRQCGSLGCDRQLVLYGRLQLAWLTLRHTEATTEQLEHAARELRASLPALAAEQNPYETANQRLNLAFLELRTGGDPRPALPELRRLAAAPGIGSAGRQTLSGWGALLAGLAALARGEAPAALAACAAIASADPELVAARFSCLGRADRLAGDLPAARRDFAAALGQHGRIAAGLDQRLPLGPGERGEDFARAARVAVESGDPAAGWELLRRLDSLSFQEQERARCRGLARGEAARRWAAIDQEAAGLLRDLGALPRLASGSRERQAADVRVGLEERLRRLWREWPGCAAPAEADDAGVELRAFAVEDEVLLLRREGASRVRLERRTAWPRRDRLTVLRAVAAELEAGGGDAGAAGRWRSLAVPPLATALLPLAAGRLGPVTTFALHGSLQLVPLAALPLASPLPDGRRWLGEVTTVALHTAGGRQAAERGGGERPLFVVDPSGDLGEAERSLPVYRRLFPGSRVLHGREATREAVLGALAGASWLHVDAHASYDPVFPEMSRLELADGELGLMEWARLPAPGRFANLSGCRTASWPATADSGQYGLGGLLTRLGVGWVVATRGPVPDAAADRYNQAFYRAVAGGLPVPAAHASGLAALRPVAPPQVWGAILLLRAAASAPEGQSSPPPTPSLQMRDHR
jgi:DNA-directed RNA polymerase specialized sigma24 family protein